MSRDLRAVSRPRTDLDDIGDTTAGGTPTGTGISGNEVPAVPDAIEPEDEADEGDEVAPGTSGP